MSPWDVLWTTLATFVGSIPAVVLGIIIGIRIDRRRAARASAQVRNRYFASLRAPGGILYQTRDWARSVEVAAQSKTPVGTFPLQRHSRSLLMWFLESGRVIETSEEDFLTLIGLSDRLHEIVDPRIGQVLAAPLDDLAAGDANELGDIVNALIQQAQAAAQVAQPRKQLDQIAG